MKKRRKLRRFLRLSVKSLFFAGEGSALKIQRKYRCFQRCHSYAEAFSARVSAFIIASTLSLFICRVQPPMWSS